MALELRRKASLKWKSNTFTLLMYLVMEHKKDTAFSKFLLVWQMDDDRPSRPLQEEDHIMPINLEVCYVKE